MCPWTLINQVSSDFPFFGGGWGVLVTEKSLSIHLVNRAGPPGRQKNTGLGQGSYILDPTSN